eukprot:scaffold5869_cov165-Amphora_coffeaeformis.AAC.12
MKILSGHFRIVRSCLLLGQNNRVNDKRVSAQRTELEGADAVFRKCFERRKIDVRLGLINNVKCGRWSRRAKMRGGSCVSKE